MGRFSIAAILLILLGPCALFSAPAQTLDKLNLQAHGYATQAFIFSNRNNWNTTNSTSGSVAWTEGVFNVNAQPNYRLRIGAQTRSYVLGGYGNKFLFDWAVVEYKVNEHLGLRAGKVKTPTALLGETQDIDPAHLWILLPQSIYPIASRTANLSNYGGVLFGSMALGESFGRLEYRGYWGERLIPSDDRYLDTLKAFGLAAPQGVKGPGDGGSVRWRTPVRGLYIGTAFSSEHPSGNLLYGPLSGTLTVHPINQPYFFGRYEHNKFSLLAEYNRYALHAIFTFPHVPPIHDQADQRNYYAAATYKILPKLTGGAYYSSALDRRAPFTAARYQKDWTLTARYDFDSYLYLKAEQHFLDGTLIGYTAPNNSSGLAETSHLRLAKLGVSF